LFFLVVHALKLLGPPPPSVAAVVWRAQAIWLLVAWGFCIGRHRVDDGLTPLSSKANKDERPNL